MGFFSKLFGGGSDKGLAAPVAEEMHDGYAIAATPMPDGGQYRLHGTITKDEKVHTLIRADLFASQDECAAATIMKAKQVIAEQGEMIFR